MTPWTADGAIPTADFGLSIAGGGPLYTADGFTSAAPIIPPPGPPSGLPLPGADGYRLYVNGVPQAGIMTGNTTLVTGLARGTEYVFAIVATLQGVDDSPLSNEIPSRHGLAEIQYRTKYPWGDTPKKGYHIKYTLGQKV